MSELRVNKFKSRTGLGTVTVSSDGLNVAGIITASSMTITGAASVGGVLTYEDVTSVDSVGIVTAQNGLHVTGGRVGVGTDNPDGDLTINGTINPQLKIKTSGTLRTSLIADTGNNETVLASHDGFPLLLSVSAGGGTAERLRITSTGLVGISSSTPKTDLDVSTKTGAVALPQGTTAQRPSGSAPYIRYNTTNSALEFYDGTSWVEIITDYFPTGSTILG